MWRVFFLGSRSSSSARALSVPFLVLSAPDPVPELPHHLTEVRVEARRLRVFRRTGLFDLRVAAAFGFRRRFLGDPYRRGCRCGQRIRVVVGHFPVSSTADNGFGATEGSRSLFGFFFVTKSHRFRSPRPVPAAVSKS